jgi:hypothetical protein
MTMFSNTPSDQERLALQLQQMAITLSARANMQERAARCMEEERNRQNLFRIGDSEIQVRIASARQDSYLEEDMDVHPSEMGDREIEARFRDYSALEREGLRKELEGLRKRRESLDAWAEAQYRGNERQGQMKGRETKRIGRN